MNWAYALNTAWMWKGRRQSRAFQGAMRNVEQTQADVLADIVTCNQVTDFGKKHRFSEIKTSEEYQDHLPLSTYDMYAEDIERIALGESNVLTRENVRLLEPTSGTTGGEKLIPYTASLARQFQCALATWITDLMRHRPAVRCGRAYWSVSPALGKPRESTGGIPIGFDDDTAYLGLFGAVGSWELTGRPTGSRANERYRELSLRDAAPPCRGRGSCANLDLESHVPLGNLWRVRAMGRENLLRPAPWHAEPPKHAWR